MMLEKFRWRSCVALHAEHPFRSRIDRFNKPAALMVMIPSRVESTIARVCASALSTFIEMPSKGIETVPARSEEETDHQPTERAETSNLQCRHRVERCPAQMI
jgi:hypothetical protein